MGKAASGEPVDSKLYKSGKPANPKALPEYWLTVIRNSGLVEDEQDIEAFKKLSSFKCDYISPKENEIKLTFTFK